MKMNLTRRSIISSLAAMSFALKAIPAAAQVTAISSVRIDASQFARNGGGVFANYVTDALNAEYARGLQGRMGNGPALLVRVKSMAFYDSNNSGGRSGNSGGGSVDYLDTEALLVGKKGELVARYDILSPVNTQTGGGGTWSPEVDRRRVVTLAQHNAGWTLRYIFG
jgi:hypothetical protein